MVVKDIEIWVPGEERDFPEDNDDIFMYDDDFFFSQPSKAIVIKEQEDCVPTQCSIACTADPKDKGKHKLLEVPKPIKKTKQVGFQGSSDTWKSYIGQGSSGVGSGFSSIDISDMQKVDNLDYLQSYGSGLVNEDVGQVYSAGVSDVSDGSNSDDPDYEPLPSDDEVDMYGYDDDDYLVDEMQQEEEQHKRLLLQGIVGQRGQNVQYEDGDFVDNEDMFGGVDSDEEPPDYIINSDGEKEEQGLYFNPKTDMARPVFKLGMMFGNVQILRDALREMAVQGGWEYQYEKNEKGRLKAICKQDDCPFLLFASKMQHESTLKIHDWIPKHKCTRIFNNSMVSLKMLVRKFKDRIALNPDWKPDSLATTMSSEIRAKVTTQMAYKAKKAALLEVEGSIREQFSRLKDYGNELKRVDPDTTVDIRCDFNNENKDPVFKRMYICLGALKKGIKAGCRKVIGLDGAFLKSPFGGQLLTAVGLDANNCSWVIAYAMVENENKDSWIWFLELLCKDLDINEDGVGWIFISDKQKGLIPACQEVVSSAHIRFCVRHMWTNFTKLYPGKEMKDQMWKCAKDTTMSYYLKDMEQMKTLNEEAYKWMTHEDRPPKHWCRAFFNTTSNCDIMENNICESFNSWMVEARGKPPITMFEEIRWKLMKRIHLRKEKMEKYEDTICPKPRKSLEKNKLKAATDCISTFNGGDEAEVENYDKSTNVVNLRLRTCSCRRWDLTGIPCKHAVSAIYEKRHDPDDYVAECYSKKIYMAIYNNFISPVTSMDMWSKCEDPPILPPSYSRQPGRPKTKRVKDLSERMQPTEGKLGRQQRSLTCSNCRQVGHNVKTCKTHLPPKDNKKRKPNNEGGQSSDKGKKGKAAPMTTNELRAKARERAEHQKKKYAAAKAAKMAANRSVSSTSRPTQVRAVPTNSRPVQSAAISSSSNKKAATSPRTSQRIKNRSGDGHGKLS